MRRFNRSIAVFSILLVALILSACHPITVTQEVGQPEPRPLIPRQILFGNPDKVSVQLSPDGIRISYRAPLDGVMNVWVGPADDPAAAKPVTNDTGRGILTYGWTYTNDHLLYIQDKQGDENWRVYSVNLNTDEIQDLTPLEGVQARIQAVSPKFPNQIMVALNDRVPQLHDLYRVNIDTGERQLVQKNEGFARFGTDDDYQVRYAVRVTPDGGSEYLTPSPEGGWEPFVQIPMEDLLTTSLLWFDSTGRALYMIDSRNRDTSALFSLDVDTGEQSLIAQDPQADVSDVMVHPTEKNVQAVAFTYDRKHWQIVDESIDEDLAYLRTVADGEVEVTGRTLDDQYWIVAYLMDDGPVRYYYYDRQAQAAQFLFTHRQALEEQPLAKMVPVVIDSRDGLNLVSYYTLPLGSDLDGDAQPDEPLPMVLLVHGGPWGRDNWGYNSLHQLLANRGYAVLSVNFRASTGFGKTFINAGNLEWGGKMHDDLIDAVEWAVQEGIADPERVAIMGGSYGGYATLVGLTFTPERFACGVDIVGVSNLVTWMETIPPYWEPQIELFASRIGDHRTEEGRAFLTQRSPLTYVERIQRPLLIGQGANDPRVKQAESDQIVQAMQEKGIPVTYLLYPDEGHGFARPENTLSFFAVSEAFLSACLGGRYEPIGDDLQGSSITVPVGAQEVPGLTKALADLPPAPTIKTIGGETMSVDQLETFITQRMEQAGVSGLSCAIINDAQVVYRKAFGVKDSRSGAQNDEETIFAAASLSKPLFAYLVMLLAEEGIIDLDRPLHEYLNKPLPEYPNYADLKEDERYKQITARMALSHSTGFPNLRIFTEDGRLTILFEPGARFSYSGEGILMLQMVVEELTGQDLEALGQEKVFGPLRMGRTSYVWQEAYEDNFALPHDEFGRPKRLNRRHEADAAGSLATTAGDYARFLVELLNAEEPRKTTVGEMLRPQIAITSQSMFGPGAWQDTGEDRAVQLAWGLGWGRFDSAEHGRAFFHTGHDFGWQNYTVTYADRGIGIVLLSNSDNFESVAKEIVEQAIGDRYSPFDWLGYVPFDPTLKKTPPLEPVAVDVRLAILAANAGIYELASGQKIEIKLEEGSLHVAGDDGSWAQMLAESDTRFFIEGEDIRFVFVKDDSGTVTGLSLQIQDLELPATKIE